MADAISAIGQAKTPPDAVSAYARGLALYRNSAPLYQAYVKRLVEMDLPDLAVAPAQTLVGLQPDNSLALAVLAIDAAEHGDMRMAVTDAVVAGTHNSEEPFVQHAAAQVFAWYDTAPDHTMVPASIVSSLEALRPQIQGKTYFADAYKQAVTMYQERAAEAAKAAAAGNQPPAVAAAPTGPKPDVPDTHTPTVAPAAPPPAPAPAPAAAAVPAPATPAPAVTYYPPPPATTYVYPAPTYVYDSPPVYYGPAYYPYGYGGYPFLGLSFGFRFGGGGHGGWHGGHR